MTSETKIGLLVGMGVIILIGILVSEHLSKAQRQQHAQFDQSADELDEGMIPSPPAAGSFGTDRRDSAARDEPLPTPEELTPPEREPAVASEGDRAARQESPARSDDQHEAPFILRQDHLWETMRIDPVEPRDTPSRPERSGGASEGRSGGSGPRDSGGLGEDFVVTEGPGQPPRASADRAGRSAAEINPPARDEPRRIVHYIGENETLSGIARRYYDDPNYWRSIYEANREAIPNPDVLRPGVRIVIPNEAGRATTTADAGRSESSESSGGTRDYTVRSGESLSTIARRVYGSMADWPKLYELNKDRLDNPDRLSEGDVIRVPSR